MKKASYLKLFHGENGTMVALFAIDREWFENVPAFTVFSGSVGDLDPMPTYEEMIYITDFSATKFTLEFISKYTDYDSDVLSYVNKVEAADGQPLEPSVKSALTDFVVGCKEDGTWNFIKACCVMAGARTFAGAMVPLVGPAPTSFNFLFSDYSRTTGLKGDGSTKYLVANRNNNDDALNSQHLSVYATEANSLDGSHLIAGGGASGNNSVISYWTRGGGLHARSRSSTSAYAWSELQPEGFVGISRLDGATINRRAFKNDYPVTLNANSPATDIMISVFAGTEARGAGLRFSNARLSFYSIGENIDLSKLEARVTALMDSLAKAEIQELAT